MIPSTTPPPPNCFSASSFSLSPTQITSEKKKKKSKQWCYLEPLPSPISRSTRPSPPVMFVPPFQGKITVIALVVLTVNTYILKPKGKKY